MRHVDKLNQLLRGYNTALSNLKPVEKKLLDKQINKLNRWMDKGSENHNWFSLSISEYIRDCQKAIDEFKETKSRVLQHAQNIEKKVINIETAIIVREIDFERKQPMDLSEFSEYFDGFLNKALVELVKDYQNIGDMYLKSIEECTVKTNMQGAVEMRPYYAYWERRIFNAITKMIIRALSANKVLWMRTEKPSLIKMTASYAHPEVTYHPTLDELRGQLEKFTRNILESTKQFGRWWDGFCKIFEERIHEETSEKYIPYTFYDDVMLNPVITHLHYEICQMRNQVVDKFSYFSRGWIKKLDFKKLFDKNELTKLQKMLFKNQQTFKIEESILSLKRYYQQIHEMPDMNYNFFVLINYQEVKSQAFEKVNEWLNVLGESLIDISQKELKNIVNDIGEYEKHLKTEVHGIDGLKHVLNIISEIKNTSMDMEFRINEIVEQFRVLKMYNYVVKSDVQQQVDVLAQTWVDLIEMADRKDFELNEYKRNFSEVTKGDVLKFKKDLQEAYEKYLHHGPGSEGVTLEEGVTRLEESKELNEQFNRKREEYVLAEKLFNLPISKYPELIKMEQDNMIYDEIYAIFKSH